MNSMARWTSRRYIGVGLILIAMFLVSLYGLTDNLLSAQASSLKITRTFNILNHAPVGTAALLWSQTNHTLLVTVVVSGLAPKSTHPDAIHNDVGGGCTNSNHGDVVYGLNPVNADSFGKGTSITTIPNVQQGIPGHGWYIDIHNGPQLDGESQQERIACANIINSNALISTPQPPSSSNLPTASNTTLSNESTTHGTISNESPSANPTSNPVMGNSQVVNVTFGGSADNDQLLSLGAAELSISHSKGKDHLTVKIFLYRLVPKSSHVAHIHIGSCENQGSVLYPLNSVKADAIGFGTSTTVIDNVSSIPETGWYLNIHKASPSDDLNNQTRFDPVACVNISTSNATSTLASPTITSPVTPTPFVE